MVSTADLDDEIPSIDEIMHLLADDITDHETLDTAHSLAATHIHDADVETLHGRPPQSESGSLRESVSHHIQPSTPLQTVSAPASPHQQGGSASTTPMDFSSHPHPGQHHASTSSTEPHIAPHVNITNPPQIAHHHTHHRTHQPWAIDPAMTVWSELPYGNWGRRLGRLAESAP